MAFEIDPEYFTMADKRINVEQAQFSIFDFMGGGSSEEKESMEAPEGKREAAGIDRATAAGLFE